MKTTIIRVGGGPVTLRAFAEKHNLEMEVHERPGVAGSSRYYAHFHRTEVSGNGVLIGAYGDGDTPARAISEYAMQIAGKRIVVNAWTPDRREIQCPNEWLEEVSAKQP